MIYYIHTFIAHIKFTLVQSWVSKSGSHIVTKLNFFFYQSRIRKPVLLQIRIYRLFKNQLINQTNYFFILNRVYFLHRNNKIFSDSSNNSR